MGVRVPATSLERKKPFRSDECICNILDILSSTAAIERGSGVGGNRLIDVRRCGERTSIGISV
jgi:hypothetical protein